MPTGGHLGPRCILTFWDNVTTGGHKKTGKNNKTRFGLSKINITKSHQLQKINKTK